MRFAICDLSIEICDVGLFVDGCVASPRVLADRRFGAFICGSGRRRFFLRKGKNGNGYRVVGCAICDLRLFC